MIVTLSVIIQKFAFLLKHHQPGHIDNRNQNKTAHKAKDEARSVQIAKSDFFQPWGTILAKKTRR